MSSQQPTPANQPDITPLPQIRAQPVDPELAASQVAVDKRIEERHAGDPDVAKTEASPVANPPVIHSRSMDEIEREMEETRQRLLSTVDELKGAVTETVSPKRIMERQVDKVRAYYVDEYGAVRPERVAKTVAIVVGVVVVVKVTKRALS